MRTGTLTVWGCWLLAAASVWSQAKEIAAQKVLTDQRDGNWSIRLQYESPGAAGLKFLLDDIRLPEGARLILREVSEEGVPGTEVPVVAYQNGPQWTGVVRSAKAEFEVVFAGETVSTLPFRVADMRAVSSEEIEQADRAAQAAVLLARPEREGKTGKVQVNGREVEYTVRGGFAEIEGDILLGPVESIEAANGKGPRAAMGLTLTNTNRWPGGVVPYEIDPTMPDQFRITDAVNHWNTLLSGTITLKPRTTESIYVTFVNSASAGTCNSYIGNQRMSAQPINIGAYCGTGNVIHEIGHAIGLFHEHTREDRNTFVKVNFENISSGMSGNFDQQNSIADDLGSYDYGSIMHYPGNAFSSNGLPTIETIPAGIPIGQRSGLSSGDIAGVRLMYPTIVPGAPVPVSIASNPSGRALTVDGTTVTTTWNTSWVPGSVHTVSAPNQGTTDTRYVFRSWSDGGAQTHDVTTPATPLSLTANYTVQYKVRGSSSNTLQGSVAVSPASADEFYTSGNSVTLTATPAAGSCLASWSGITAPPASPLQAVVNQPLSATAVFQTGSVTAAPTAVTVASKGESRTITVTATTGCVWSARSNASWITITSGASGTSSGTVAFTVARRNGNKVRTGTITVGTQVVTITQ